MIDHDAQRAMVLASLDATHHPDMYRLRPRGTAAHTPPAVAECAATGRPTPTGAVAPLLSAAAAPNGTHNVTRPRDAHPEAA